MNWNAFNTHNDSYENAFEAFSIQLFEHYLRRSYPAGLREFYAISGSGGDGGVEAYGVVPAGTIGLQAKWFTTALNANQIKNIKESILTAKKIRPELTEYIITLPKRVNSKKAVKGKRVGSSEQDRLLEMENVVLQQHPTLKITWWFENLLLEQLEFPDSRFIESYWFGRNFLTLDLLRSKFRDQGEHQWLKTRYAPDLNAEGEIAAHYDELCLSQQFKSELSGKLQSLGNKLASIANLINAYIKGQDRTPSNEETNLGNQLECILICIIEYQNNIELLATALQNGSVPELLVLPEYDLWKPKMAVERIRPTNIQIPVAKSLARALEKIHQIHVPQYLCALRDEMIRKIKIFFGSAGTGKTQGLAHCTSKHLDGNLPAMIIPAKGTPCGNWTQILSSQLELPERSAQEIFTALESLAITELRKEAELNQSKTTHSATVLISVDGLEEDIRHWEKWYDRINDTLSITDSFPRIRFMFSAREYFWDNNKIPETVPFEQVRLPNEGDISINDAAEIYFSPMHFNISNVNSDVMNRIESLYALKLFCERYHGADLHFSEDVHTDLRSLLSDKIDALEIEFKNGSDRRFSSSSSPVGDTLLAISQQFFTEISLEHSKLLRVLDEQIPSLSYTELEVMLEFLSERGILTAGMHETMGVIKKREIFYYVSYQSIIEHVISEDIFIKLIKGDIDHIPPIALSGIVGPLKLGIVDPEAAFPNETMTEAILKRVFLKTGRLVGQDGYLAADMPQEEITAMQMAVLAVADKQHGPKYEHMVKNWLAMGHWHQQQVFIRVIRPASKIGAFFNPLWLHHHLLSIPTVYERDKFLWADRSVRAHDNYDGLEAAIYPFDGYDTSLYPFDHFDQEPLIYAWCLSSPSRNMRKELRSSLLNWANLNLAEWIKLLELMKDQQDSQILEDLASVSLGLSYTLKETSDVLLLSDWVLANIFASPDTYLSSRVREGFRGIIDRATELGAISKEDGALARPKKRNAPLLPLAKDALEKNSEQFFPVVSDLAWYVLENSYEDFLEESYHAEDGDQELSEQIKFLKQYSAPYKIDSLTPTLWAQAAVIALVRNQFGYLEKSGNVALLPSHGEKGLIMYFAEKYIWQAVYSVQGYLSEQLPLIDEARYIKSYREIVNVSNPAEGPMHNGDLLSSLDDIPGPGWLIPENLVNSVSIEPKLIKKGIHKEIDEPDGLNLHLWLEYRDRTGKIWRHLFGQTTLSDKNQVVYGRITANATLMRPDAFQRFLDIIHTSPKDIYFLSSLDTLLATPSGSFYQNPSDIVDGKDIGEDEPDTLLEIDGEESNLYHSIIKVVQSENNNEKTYHLPSRIVRELVGIKQLKGKRLKDYNGETIGFVTEIGREGEENSQRLTTVAADILDAGLADTTYQLLWFVEVFKRTTLGIEKDGLFLRRTRKYLVWIEDNVYKQHKFWDGESSN